jgi:hypothetical protein
LVKLLTDHAVTHVAVAFDSIVVPATGRGSPADDDLIGAQQPSAADVVRALGLALWPARRLQVTTCSPPERLVEELRDDSVVERIPRRAS